MVGSSPHAAATIAMMASAATKRIRNFGMRSPSLPETRGNAPPRTGATIGGRGRAGNAVTGGRSIAPPGASASPPLATHPRAAVPGDPRTVWFEGVGARDPLDVGCIAERGRHVGPQVVARDVGHDRREETAGVVRLDGERTRRCPALRLHVVDEPLKDRIERQGHVHARADREHVDRGCGERQALVGLDPRGPDDDRRQAVGARPQDGFRTRRSPGPREDGAARIRRPDLRVARRSGELLRRRQQGPARRQAVSGQADRRALRGDVGGGQEQDRLPCRIDDEREPQAVPGRGGTPRRRQRDHGQPVRGQEVDRAVRGRGPGGDDRGDDAAVLDQALQRGRHVGTAQTDVDRLDLDRSPVRCAASSSPASAGAVTSSASGGDPSNRKATVGTSVADGARVPSAHAGRTSARSITRPARTTGSPRPSARYPRPARPGWRNRQTRGSQKPVGFGP